MYPVLVADERHEGYYFFHRFKMLINNRRITTKTMIKDEAGKEMEASRVFHLTIQYLKDHLNTKIIETVKEEHRQQICVFYVLTVPAKWDYSAVELMREAAIEAGIDSRQLAIVSEPEAASMFCQVVNSHLHDTQQKNSFETQFKSGKMFMMVDLGGGSADITVHQKDIYNGLLREAIPPSCGPWDGKSIDDRFYIFLTEMFGADVMAELKNTELEDMIDLFREFETKKRSIRSNQLNNVVLKLPVTLINLVRSRCKKVEIAVEKSPYRDSVIFYVQSIHIVPDTFRDLFKPTIEALVEHLNALLRQAELRDLKTIVMVGGFSECELVQHKVMERFGRNITIIIPEEAGLAVLKGAVLYGHSMSQ